MPWHLSKSDPRKVYDERHEPVCVCQTPEQASVLVDGVNFARDAGLAPRHIRLREPDTPASRGEQESGTVNPARGAAGAFDEAPVHTHQAEGCCAKALSRASFSGSLDKIRFFECPKCGTRYEPTVQDPKSEVPMVVWEPRAAVLVFKP